MTGKFLPTRYKDVSYSQLRSYCETARTGSMAAAARSLRLSHPTVWKQIRALEQLLGQTLVESDGRRSALTEAGLVLARLAAPVIAEFESLQDRFQQACRAAPQKFSVAAPPRSFTDDLMLVIGEFRSLHPDVRLTMREAFEFHGNEMLEAGEVDLVIGDSRICRRPEELTVEPIFEIEPMVIMPPGHPLSKRRRIMPEDLAKYPVLNHPDNYPDEEACAILKNAGVFEHPDRCFNLNLASSIRSCVKLGLGIGLVGRVVADHAPDPKICQRSLKHCLRPITCFGYSLPRVSENPVQRAFVNLLKARLSPARDAGKVEKRRGGSGKTNGR